MKINPQEVLSYLVAKGVPRNHALGMISNIRAESGFRPTINEVAPLVKGSRGGFGLFQHTGSRRRALEALPNFRDWKTQVDFTLSEPDTQRYLSQDFNSPEDASRWFTTQWERPANAKQKAEQRLKYLPGADVRLASNDPLPPEMQAPGDPRTGQAQMNGRLPFEDTGVPFQWEYPPGTPEATFGDRLMGDPFFRMGLGILGSPGFGGNFGQAVARGATFGLDQASQYRQELQANAMREMQYRMQMEQMQRQAMQQGMAPPEVRNLQGPGGQMVTAQWDPQSRTWVPVQPQGGFPQQAAQPGWEVRQGPGGSLVRVDPMTGQVEELMPGEQKPSMAPGDRVNWANTIADNYRAEVAPLATPVQRWNDVSTYVPGKMTGAQQRALVVSFAKALDPSSAVMEGEAAAVANAARNLPWLGDLWKKAVDSGLPEETLRDLLTELGKLAQSRYAELTDIHGRYAKQFSLAGFEDPLALSGSAAQAGPAARPVGAHGGALPGWSKVR
jgi:hypothetical protein